MTQTPSKRGSSSPTSEALVAFLATATLCLLGILVAMKLRPAWFGLAPAHTEPAPQPRVDSSPPLAQRLFEDGHGSVVHVTTRSRNRARVSMGATAGTGSGIVWDAAGHIVTTLHVVENAVAALVTLGDGSEWEARYVGRDEATDLAVVRIDAPLGALTPIRIGASHDLSVGQRVFSIACPYGARPSLAVGYVGGLERTVRSTSGTLLDGLVQTDTALDPGASGGALFDERGRAIGMSVANYSESRRQLGVGFAHPIDRLRAVVPRIIENGYRWFPEFGFVVQPDHNAEALLASFASQEGAPTSGVVVSEVVLEGPAAGAGLRSMLESPTPSGGTHFQVRDVILAANDAPVASVADLEAAMALTGPGEQLRLSLARQGGTVEVAMSRPPR